jgi:hypothetical protein
MYLSTTDEATNDLHVFFDKNNKWASGLVITSVAEFISTVVCIFICECAVQMIKSDAGKHCLERKDAIFRTVNIAGGLSEGIRVRFFP